ncbi:MAG: hypothetical protein MJ145_01600 [Clostridia bacterium]|nr:hypothetical protein [Clostridia bacterium]
MSIENIIKKITDDANLVAQNSMKQAENSKKDLLGGAEKKAAKLVEDAKVNGQDEKEKLISRKASVAQIDSRKIVLEEKQKLIAKCFDEAVNTIVSMDQDKYVALLLDIAKKAAITEGELILNEKDHKEIGKSLVEKMNGEIPGCKIVLSKETRDIKGGFIVKQEAVFINQSIESLVDETKDDLALEVANKLFK